MSLRVRRARSPVLAAAIFLFVASLLTGAVTEKGEVRQPRNIYELIYAFDHTFAKLFQADELKQIGTMTPQEIRSASPPLYDRISRNVQAWTDEWLREVRSTGDQIPEKRLGEATRMAEQVDTLLKGHFDGRKWPYRPMRVEFLPPRVFLDERHRGDLTSGMFIPFYPDAFIGVRLRVLI